MWGEEGLIAKKATLKPDMPCGLGATEAAHLLRTGALTSVDLVGSCLQQIERFEDQVGAWVYLHSDEALRKAHQADQRRRQGEPLGPLHGLPVGLKDIIDSHDMPCENGTTIHAGRRPREDSAVVAALRKAGAIILGKTVTAELAVFHPGKTKNPHNPAHTPGGSSSGSAAAVASYMVPLTIGTQTAGSIIRPASFCGVWGYKPTFGWISRAHVLSQSPSLDTIGSFARHGEDLALITDCLTGYDLRDPEMSVEKPSPLMRQLNENPHTPPCLAFARTPMWPAVDSATKEAFCTLLERLGGELCEEIELGDIFADAVHWQQLIQVKDIATSYGPLMAAEPEKMSEILRAMIEDGQLISQEDYQKARDHQHILRETVDALLKPYDALLTPATSGPAWKGLQATGSPLFNGLWTYAGVPAVTIPLFEEDGLPVGLQLIGRGGGDAGVLKAARWLAALTASR